MSIPVAVGMAGLGQAAGLPRRLSVWIMLVCCPSMRVRGNAGERVAGLRRYPYLLKLGRVEGGGKK